MIFYVSVQFAFIINSCSVRAQCYIFRVVRGAESLALAVSIGLKETSCIDYGIALSGNAKKKKRGFFKTRDHMLPNTVRFFSVGIPEFFSLGH